MQGWTDGYVTEIGYTHGFHAELLPWSMAAALGPRAPIRPDAGFDYCELGFGQGFTLALMAAANPQARFWGNDINPAHVAHVRGLATRAGLGNLTVSDRGFAEYGRAGLPGFDIIALHGVWSWVGPVQRAEIVDFIARHLKPGGVVYMGYNVLPGWGQYMPLRELMLASVMRGQGGLPDRIQGALALADRLRAAGAAHFQVNPTVSARLDQLLDRPVAYLAHEYFNENWHPTYFTDLAASLAPAGLSLAAQARAADRWEEEPRRQAILTAGGAAAADDPAFAELLRDFLSNRPFRRDLFIRVGGQAGTGDMAGQGDRIWAALGTPRDLPRRATPATLPVEPPFDEAHALLTALMQGPQAEQALLAPLGDRGPAALAALAALSLVTPALPETGLARRRESCARLNALLLADAQQADRMTALACPVTGGAVETSRIELLFLAALEKGTEPAAFAWKVLEAAGQRVLRDGRPLDTPDRNRAELADQWESFARRRLPLLRLLGAVQQDG
ncbi:class I SAM-dependent methyltransferase [Niveispirillum fermenti]|uniref:class I SAM-dependent methyltransferase n=1 Tax=Niveispirillum fermenti TaxID=1233113 RepID=UPI003A897C2D